MEKKKKNILAVLGLIFLALILILGIGLFIFLKTFDINQYKSKIAEEIGQALKRNVTIGQIFLNPSLKEGITLDVQKFSIEDNPQFSSEPFFRVEKIHLNLDLMAFFKKRQIVVSRIELREPNLNLIRNPQNLINIQSLIEEIQKSPSPSNPPSQAKEEGAGLAFAEGTSSSPVLPDFSVASIRLLNGMISFTDQTFAPPLIIPIQSIDVKISDFSLKKDFPFDVMCSLWSREQNIEAHGRAQIDAHQGLFTISDLTVKNDLSSWSVEELNKAIPNFSLVGLERNLQGHVLVQAQQLVIGPKGLEHLSLKASCENAAAKLKTLASPLENIFVQLQMNESNIDIQKLSLNAASGTITGQGSLNDYLTNQKFSLNVDIQGLEIAQLADLSKIPIEVQGKIFGKIQGAGEGFTLDALKKSLVGAGEFEIQEGKLVNFNLLNFVVEKLSMISNFEEKLNQNLPEKYKEKLKQNDTILENIKTKISVHDGVLAIDQAEANADGFAIMGNGQVNFDQSMIWQSDFHMESDLSASMIAAVPELAAIQDEKGRIFIPFVPYQGNLNSFRTYPDPQYLFSKIVKAKAGDQVNDIIDKNVPEKFKGILKDAVGDILNKF